MKQFMNNRGVSGVAPRRIPSNECWQNNADLPFSYILNEQAIKARQVTKAFGAMGVSRKKNRSRHKKNW